MVTMSDTTQGQSIAEARSMALAMFASNIPCNFQLSETGCEKAAVWVAYFTHEENTGDCDYDMAWPLCAEHRSLVQRVASPFWRMWLGLDPLHCERCEQPVRVERIEAI